MRMIPDNTLASRVIGSPGKLLFSKQKSPVVGPPLMFSDKATGERLVAVEDRLKILKS